MVSKVRPFFAEYSSNSSVHGVKYFGDKHRHWAERTFWIIVFIVSVIGCFFMVHKTYTKWQKSPIIVISEDILTPISDIPFPAITICPSIKLDLSKHNYKEYLLVMKKNASNETFEEDRNATSKAELTNEQLGIVKAVKLICSTKVLNPQDETEFTESQLNTSDIPKTLRENALPLEQTITGYTLSKYEGNEETDFQTIFTEAGVCYTFNSLGNFDVFKKDAIAETFRPYQVDQKGMNWSPEGGYEKISSKTAAIPFKAYKSTPVNGLLIDIKQYRDKVYNNCPGDFSQIMLIIHSPDEFPRVYGDFFYVPAKREVLISVKPKVMTTPKELASYSPVTRQCFFNYERNLNFFQFYSQNNCELECLVNFTLLVCGCAQVALPRNESSRVCSHADTSCLYYSEIFFSTYENTGPLWTLNKYRSIYWSGGSNDLKAIKSLMNSCNCLPACMSLDYDITITQSKYDVRQESYMHNDPGASEIIVHFNVAHFLKLKRSELYGWTDFIANFGGLMGLFMGVSILSVIEIFYYAALRLACNFHKTKKKNVNHKSVDDTKVVK